jgi:maleylacetoacetate isomerase
MTIILHGYWRSLATFRVRAALNLKGVPYTEKIVDLSKGEHLSADFAQINPQHVLPLLEHDGLFISQSLAIMEYLDDLWPEHPLLPADPAGKARVRSIALITIADVHPLIVPRVRNYLEHTCNLDEAARQQWAQHWFVQGSRAIEARLSEESSGKFTHGDTVTLADLALLSHVVGARLFQADLRDTPKLVALAERCLALEPIARAHPLAQPGAPAT